jgi:hypothetical protein
MLITPNGGKPHPRDRPIETYTVGSYVTLQWELGNSEVTRFLAVELFNFKGLLEDLWIGNISAIETSMRVNMKAHPNVKIPGTYFLRIWGESPNGPMCTTYSKLFRLVGPS